MSATKWFTIVAALAAFMSGAAVAEDQADSSRPSDMSREHAPPAPRVEGLDGDWDGTLEVNGAHLRLVFHVKTTDAEGTVATTDSIDQGALGTPVSTVSRDGSDVGFDVAVLRGGFSGRLDVSGPTIAGHWNQAGYSFPLVLTRRAAGVPQATMNRPQTPARPYPYREEDVTFDNAAAQVRLAGTLTLPRGSGPFPAVVLIAGSGPNTRNKPIVGHQVFLVLADYLTRQGIAVLRFDKRGVGASTGTFKSATSEDFADDAEAAFNFLRSRREIDSHHIGLIGHSEGGLIAPIIAARNSSVAFVILMAGTGVDGARILAEQVALISRSNGMSDAAMKKQSALLAKGVAIVNAEKDPAVAEAKLRDLLSTSGVPKEAANQMAAQFGSGWFHTFFSLDPAVALRQVQCPVLAIGGSKDLQVPAAENLTAIKAALVDNPDVEIRELPNLNHLFQTAKTGNPIEYAAIEETISPSVLWLIANWITKHAH